MSTNAFDRSARAWDSVAAEYRTLARKGTPSARRRSGLGNGPREDLSQLVLGAVAYASLAAVERIRARAIDRAMDAAARILSGGTA